MTGRSIIQTNPEVSRQICFLSTSVWPVPQTLLLTHFCSAMRRRARHARDDSDICALNLPLFYTGDLVITRLHINTESPKHVVIIRACQRRFDCYRQRVPLTKKHRKKTTCKHNTEICHSLNRAWTLFIKLKSVSFVSNTSPVKTQNTAGGSVQTRERKRPHRSRKMYDTSGPTPGSSSVCILKQTKTKNLQTFKCTVGIRS